MKNSRKGLTGLDVDTFRLRRGEINNEGLYPSGLGSSFRKYTIPDNENKHMSTIFLRLQFSEESTFSHEFRELRAQREANHTIIKSHGGSGRLMSTKVHSISCTHREA